MTKDDIFYGVYAMLHHPSYRDTFASDLAKMLPRIPLVNGFPEFARLGHELAQLHLDYESAPPHPNFARGIAFWCVSIAAAVDEEIVAGVIFDPVHNHMYRANDHGAWLNDHKLQAVGRTSETEALILTQFPTPADIRAHAAALTQCGDILSTYAAVRNLNSGRCALRRRRRGRTAPSTSRRTPGTSPPAATYFARRAEPIARSPAAKSDSLTVISFCRTI